MDVLLPWVVVPPVPSNSTEDLIALCNMPKRNVTSLTVHLPSTVAPWQPNQPVQSTALLARVPSDDDASWSSFQDSRTPPLSNRSQPLTASLIAALESQVNKRVAKLQLNTAPIAVTADDLNTIPFDRCHHSTDGFCVSLLARSGAADSQPAVSPITNIDQLLGDPKYKRAGEWLSVTVSGGVPEVDVLVNIAERAVAVRVHSFAPQAMTSCFAVRRNCLSDPLLLFGSDRLQKLNGCTFQVGGSHTAHCHPTTELCGFVSGQCTLCVDTALRRIVSNLKQVHVWLNALRDTAGSPPSLIVDLTGVAGGHSAVW